MARCGSPAIFAPNGDRDRASVYRCERERGHDGGHGARGLSWSRAYPPPSAKRLAAVQRGERDPLE